MTKIYVRSAAGRVARVSPQGRYIPHDTPVGVPLTPYMQRRIDQKDVVVVAQPVAKKAPTSSTPATAQDEVKAQAVTKTK